MENSSVGTIDAKAMTEQCYSMSLYKHFSVTSSFLCFKIKKLTKKCGIRCVNFDLTASMLYYLMRARREFYFRQNNSSGDIVFHGFSGQIKLLYCRSLLTTCYRICVVRCAMNKTTNTVKESERLTTTKTIFLV